MNSAPIRQVSFLLLCVAEFRKLRGRGLLYAVLIFGAAHGLAANAAIKAMEVIGGNMSETQLGQDFGDPVDFSVAGELALNLAVTPVNGFALLFLFAILWAEDFSLGTMAMIFSRPVPRTKVFAAKCSVALACGAASLSLAVLTGLTLGLALFGTAGDITMLETVPFVGWMAQFPGVATRLLHTASGVVAGTLLLVPVVGITALIGNLTRSPVMTLFGSMLALFADFFIHSVLGLWGRSDLESAEVVLAISRWNIWAGRDLFEVHGPWGGAWAAHEVDAASARLAAEAAALPETAWAMLGQPLIATVAWGVLLGGLALAMFCKRDVT